MPFDAVLALTLAASVGGVPTAWTPDERRLDERVRQPGPYYELLNLAYEQDPVALGLVFATPQRIAEASFGFSSLGGRVYEPGHDSAFLEVRVAGRWRAVVAHRTRDYTRIGELAPAQGRGTAYWIYRFAPMAVEGVRLRADAPAHLDPGYRCLALAYLAAADGPAPRSPRGERVVGDPPRDAPDFLRNGANLLAKETGARWTRSGMSREVRWPRPMIVNRVDAREGTSGLTVQYRTRSGWRDATVTAERPLRFLPVATDGLRFKGGEPDAVMLDTEGERYFERLRVGRSDLLGRRFRSSERPDLAEMESYLLPIDFSMGAVGRPADLHETMTFWNGMFLMVEGGEGAYPRDGAPAPAQALDRWFLPLTNGHDWGEDLNRTKARLAEGGLPAVRTTHDRDGIRCEQTLFVTAPDDPFYTNVTRVTVRNSSRRRKAVTFGYAMGRRPVWQPEWTPFLQDPWPTGYTLDRDGCTVRNAKGEIVFASTAPGVWEGTERENRFLVHLDLAPNESKELAFAFPNVDAPIATMPPFDAGSAEGRFAAWWTKALGGPGSISVPEEPLNDVLRNLVAQSLIIALDGDEVRYGAYFYETYFGVEEGWPAVALAQYGHPEPAKKIAEIMLSDVHMDKANHHHQYRNGLAPWYAVTVARITRDDDWLRRIWPKLEAAAEWTIRVTSENKDPAYGGILPRHVYGGDIGNPAYSFYSNATCWRGLYDTAIAAERLGLADKAERYRSAADRYRTRLLELADNLVDRSTGLPFLPMAFEVGAGATYRKSEPPYAFLAAHVLIGDLWTYLGNYWNLFAPLLLEVRLFPEGDPRGRWIPDYMEQRAGVLNGLVRFDLGYDSVYGKGYTESLLEQGRRDEFLTALYGLFGHALSRNFAVMPEVSKVFDLRTDNVAMYREYRRMRWNYFYRFVGPWLEGWQGQEGDPLAAGAGMALQVMRMAVVREDYVTDPPVALRLLDGAPLQWFEPGKRIVVNETNTFFGPVSLDCRASARGLALVVTVPSEVPYRLRLPSPDGRPTTIRVDGETVRADADDSVSLKGTGGPTKIAVAF
ncbi:MAG: hypothetical protein KIS66_01215 [Fimbriimonadaceae bacterium]|nr:hypothetical protein [Fimbriimonadaceae bacterium]